MDRTCDVDRTCDMDRQVVCVTILGGLVLAYCYALSHDIERKLGEERDTKCQNLQDDDVYQSSGSKDFHLTQHQGSCDCKRMKFKIKPHQKILSVGECRNKVPSNSKIRFPRVTVPFDCFELLADESTISLHVAEKPEQLSVCVSKRTKELFAFCR
jgi:hypothetical protein